MITDLLHVPCFNPRPARRPGATRVTARSPISWFSEAVSILARPAGRALRRPQDLGDGSTTLEVRFNPRPARRPGATASGNHRATALVGRSRSFNPRPARRPGATSSGGGRAWRELHLVSILARPAGRALRLYRTAESARDAATLRFQSSPGPQAGRYAMQAIRGWAAATVQVFQSSPGPQAGRYLRIAANEHSLRVALFQSSPGPQAGRYFATPRAVGAAVQFQSSPGPQAGRYPWGSMWTGTIAKRGRVSILARPAGRALLSMARGFDVRSATATRFNPRPARRPGATLPNPRYGARALDYCRLSGGCHAQRRVPRPRDPQIRPLYGTNSARTAGLKAIAEDSRSCVTQNTNVPRWSNGGRAPNVRRCRASGSRRR